MNFFKDFNNEKDGDLPIKEQNLDILNDIEMKVEVRIGETKMRVNELLNISEGMIIPLNTEEQEPFDILVNGNKLAKGMIVVINGKFAIRVTEIKKGG